MDLSRQQIVKALRRAGMNEVADSAEASLPEIVDSTTVERFCVAHGVSKSMLMDRMGGSP